MESKNAVRNLANSIHKEFIRMLESVSWMDETTRKIAIEKAMAINFFIGYPDELIDNAKLDEYYRDLELQPDSLLHSILSIQKFDANQLAKTFRQPTDKNEWTSLSKESTVVNAFYVPQQNTVSKFMSFSSLPVFIYEMNTKNSFFCSELTAGILQDQLFSADR